MASVKPSPKQFILKQFLKQEKSIVLNRSTNQVEIDEVAADVALFDQLCHSRQLLRAAATKLNSEDFLGPVTLNKSPFGSVSLKQL